MNILVSNAKKALEQAAIPTSQNQTHQPTSEEVCTITPLSQTRKAIFIIFSIFWCTVGMITEVYLLGAPTGISLLISVTLTIKLYKNLKNNYLSLWVYLAVLFTGGLASLHITLISRYINASPISLLQFWYLGLYQDFYSEEINDIWSYVTYKWKFVHIAYFIISYFYILTVNTPRWRHRNILLILPFIVGVALLIANTVYLKTNLVPKIIEQRQMTQHALSLQQEQLDCLNKYILESQSQNDIEGWHADTAAHTCSVIRTRTYTGTTSESRIIRGSVKAGEKFMADMGDGKTIILLPTYALDGWALLIANGPLATGAEMASYEIEQRNLSFDSNYHHAVWISRDLCKNQPNFPNRTLNYGFSYFINSDEHARLKYATNESMGWFYSSSKLGSGVLKIGKVLESSTTSSARTQEEGGVGCSDNVVDQIDFEIEIIPNPELLIPSKLQSRTDLQEFMIKKCSQSFEEMQNLVLAT